MRSNGVRVKNALWRLIQVSRLMGYNLSKTFWMLKMSHNGRMRRMKMKALKKVIFNIFLFNFFNRGGNTI